MYDKPFRLHISSIIEQSFKVFGIIIVVLIANFFNLVSDLASGEIGFNEMMISVLGLFGFILLLVSFFYIRWRKTYIILLKDTLIIERNFLFKYKMTVGLKNIATVELEQNVFERFLDTAKVKIDTNSLSTANQTDLKIILKKNLADQLRKELLIYIDKAKYGSERTEKDVEAILETESESKFDVEYKFIDVIKYTFLSIPLYSIACSIISVIWALYVFCFETSLVGDDYIASIFAIILFIVPIIYSTLSKLFKLYNFKARRIEDKVHIEYGLLTKKKYTIPIDKINAIIVKQPFFARLVKMYTVEIVNIGMGEEEKEVPVLLLMSTKKEMLEKMNMLLPEIYINQEGTKQPQKAIIPISIGVAIYSIIASLCICAFAPIISYLGILGFAMITIILGYYTKYLAYNDKFVYVTNGVFQKKTVIIKYEKMQKYALKSNFITKKLHLNKACINVLASTANVEHSTGYFDENIFEEINKNFI